MSTAVGVASPNLGEAGQHRGGAPETPMRRFPEAYALREPHAPHDAKPQVAKLACEISTSCLEVPGSDHFGVPIMLEAGKRVAQVRLGDALFWRHQADRTNGTKS